MRSSRFIAPLLSGALASLPASAATLQAVQIPALRAWCETRTLSKADAEQAAIVDQAREDIAKGLDKALFEAGITYSGLPFVAAARKVSTPAPPPPVTTPPTPQAPPIETFSLEVCAPVAPSALQAPSAPYAVRTLPPATYSVLPCEALTEEACVADLRKAMLDAFGADKKAQIYESPIVMTRSVQSLDAAAIALAFQSARDRATFRALTVSGTGASGVDLAAKVQRPLLLNSQAAVIVSGAPVPGQLVAAIPAPS